MEILSLAAGGDGVARLAEGLTLFVPFAAPGDRVRVRIVARHRRFARGEITELLRAGPGRCAPRCGVFGRCGGCEWQHLDYSEQVAAKRDILRDALVRIGGWGAVPELSFTPSPSPYFYRARARWLTRSGAVGYRERASHALCAPDVCPILVSSLGAELSRLAGTEPEDPAGEVEFEWEAIAGHDDHVRSTRLGPGGRLESAAGAPHRGIELRVGGDLLTISPGTFIQANRLLHEQLHQAVIVCAGSGRHVLELYAGAGFFTLALARRFAAVEAVEASPGAVADLQSNLRAAGLDGVRVIEGDVEKVLASAPAPAPDVVLLDPPRAGLSTEAVDRLAALQAPRIVYLSCDPATLSRDSAGLRQHGYALESVRGFDLFPQTSHVEALAVMVRSADPER
ncbi:MAG: class I SAM-dependent RNA methyltransferase [Myxococcota bacterium]|nr:class I SAM-dependent RNA methyltransferase [Myxococcota bacterium]